MNNSPLLSSERVQNYTNSMTLLHELSTIALPIFLSGNNNILNKTYGISWRASDDGRLYRAFRLLHIFRQGGHG